MYGDLSSSCFGNDDALECTERLDDFEPSSVCDPTRIIRLGYKHNARSAHIVPDRIALGGNARELNCIIATRRLVSAIARQPSNGGGVGYCHFILPVDLPALQRG